MSDAVEQLLDEPWDDEGGSGAHAGGGWARQPRPWWAWTLAALALGAAALVGGGLQLSGVELGTTLRARACDPSPLPGVALLVLAGLLLALGCSLARLHHDGSRLEWDVAALVVAVPVPATLLALTLPGVLGCDAASDIAAIGLVGDALVGQAGAMACAASAAVLGLALASAAHVTRVEHLAVGAAEPPGLVELAMQEAEAMRAEGFGQRFHGVDSGD
ncbi:MAG: hypothetical protein JWM98_62 [Thermoleophilia bacterium]|nr:hypothetical protein [Thermoleophilia bacterium]